MEFDQSVKCFNATLPARAGKVNFEALVLLSPTWLWRLLGKDKPGVNVKHLYPNSLENIHASATTRAWLVSTGNYLGLYEDNPSSMLLASCLLEIEEKTIQSWDSGLTNVPGERSRTFAPTNNKPNRGSWQEQTRGIGNRTTGKVT